MVRELKRAAAAIAAALTTAILLATASPTAPALAASGRTTVCPRDQAGNTLPSPTSWTLTATPSTGSAFTAPLNLSGCVDISLSSSGSPWGIAVAFGSDTITLPSLQVTSAGVVIPTGPGSPVGAASGDLTGNYPGPTIAANAVTSTKLANGAVGANQLAANAVTSLNVATALANAGDVRINSSAFTYRDNQGTPANHTLSALDLAETWTGLKTASGGIAFGGTAHGVVIGEAAAAHAVTGAGSSGQPLLSGGASADPAYGNLTVGAGGTGATSLTQFGVLCGGGTGAITAIAPDASTTKVLTSGGSSACPTWQTPGASVTSTSGTTFLSAVVNFTGAFDTAVSTGSIGGSGQTIQLTAAACATTAAGSTTWLMEITDGTTVFAEESWHDPNGAASCFSIPPLVVSPSAAATYTLKVKNATAANGTILATDPSGSTTNKSTYISWVRLS